MAAASNELPAPEERPSRWALLPADLPLVALAVFCFLLLSYIPMGDADLWGHLTYGGWILDHGSLPEEDPAQPLAEGMEVLDAEWLSQVALAAVDRAGGLEGLSGLLALVGLGTLLLLLRTFYLQTGSRLLSAVGVLMVLPLSWSRWTSLGPESSALLCFAVLLWLMVSSGAAEGGEEPRRPWRLWLGVPLLLCVWANLDPSFVWGLGLLGCFAVGRLLEVAGQRRRVREVLADRRLRRWLVLTELAVAACLLNPYGIDLLLRAPWWPGAEALRGLPGEQPLLIRGVAGWAFMVTMAVLLVVLRHSRRPVPVAHALALALFAAASVLRVDVLTGYALVFALGVMPHLADLLERRTMPTDGEGPKAGRWQHLARASWHSSVLAGLMVWAALALSPWGNALLRGGSRPPDALLAPATPRQLTEYLRAEPPTGQIFNPWWWGDWLVRDGPSELRPFATSRLRALPDRVWRDYERVAGAGSDWQGVLDRYRIRTVVLDRGRMPFQIQALRNTEEWWPAHEDPQAVVFRRLPAPPKGVRSASVQVGGGEEKGER